MSEVDSAPAIRRARHHTPGTVGAELERDRLRARRRRVTAAITELCRRAHHQEAELGHAHGPIRQAIDDFAAQAAAIDARLRELTR